MSGINGQLKATLNDFREASARVEDIHSHVTGPTGITQTVRSISDDTRYLDKLPVMAGSIRMLAWTNVILVSLLSIIVVTIVVKGSNIRINIPGWLEINGNHLP